MGGLRCWWALMGNSLHILKISPWQEARSHNNHTSEPLLWGVASSVLHVHVLSLQGTQNTPVCLYTCTHTHIEHTRFFKTVSALSPSVHTGMSPFVDKQLRYLSIARIQEHIPINVTFCYHRLYNRWCLISRHPSLPYDKTGGFVIWHFFNMQNYVRRSPPLLRCVCGLCV